jgi:hypothetical protein
MAAGCDAVLFCNGVLPDMQEVAKVAPELSREAAARYRAPFQNLQIADKEALPRRLKSALPHSLESAAALNTDHTDSVDFPDLSDLNHIANAGQAFDAALNAMGYTWTSQISRIGEKRPDAPPAALHTSHR